MHDVGVEANFPLPGPDTADAAAQTDFPLSPRDAGRSNVEPAVPQLDLPELVEEEEESPPPGMLNLGGAPPAGLGVAGPLLSALRLVPGIAPPDNPPPPTAPGQLYKQARDWSFDCYDLMI